MTYLRSISRLVVVFLALTVITTAAVPAGWIALRYEPPSGQDQKGHWIIVKEPVGGLAAWWSDAELASIVANDPNYVKRLETEWNPEAHPMGTANEASDLAAELAQYWDGDLPQANYWAHGAMVRRGSTMEAYRWTQDGLTQRTALEQSGKRPEIPAAALDPNPVDQRHSNGNDIVTSGDRWGSHLRTGTLNHIFISEQNKAQRRHHPNPPPAGEVAQKASETVDACRQASLDTEMVVFENYVRAWSGLAPKSATFGLPNNCVTNPGPLLVLAPPPPPPPPPPVTQPPPPPPVSQPPPPPPVSQPPPPAPVTPPSPPPAPVTPPSPPPPPVPPPPVQPPPPPPDDYEACDGTMHSTQSAADAVTCKPPVEDKYYDCNGDPHNSQSAADAVSCDPKKPIAPPQDDPQYTACDGTLHYSQEDADAIPCYGEETDSELNDEYCQFSFEPGCDGF